MTIKILNTESELKSFPSSQSIVLFSTEELETTSLKSNILLFRLQTEGNLTSLAEPYSYNLGYLKETFDVVELDFKVEQVTEGYNITCTPSRLLNLDSLFCLYISSTLSNKYLTISKLNSKSNSTIDVHLKKTFTVKSDFSLKIEDTSYIVNDKNIVKLTFDGRTQTVDVRSKKILLSNDVEVTLKDTIYVKDEEFSIKIEPFESASETLQCYISTVNSKTIKPIPLEETSTKVSNSSILDFYSNMNKTEIIKVEKSLPKYLDHNVFSIKIPEGFKLDKTNPNLKATISIVFNNYLLNSLGLYDKDKKYILTIYLDEFENELILEINYTHDVTQSEQLIINLDNLD